METLNADIVDSKAIFNVLHSRVENSPVYSTFKRVLYNLCRIQTSQSDSGQIWYTIEKIVQEVTKAECNEDPQSLVGETHPLPIHTLESKETQTKWDANTSPNPCSEGDENTLRDALNENSESGGEMTEQTPAPPLPPPPPPPSAPPCIPETPLAPPIPTPEPKCKLKHIMWTKISNVPSEKKSIWRDILEMPDKIKVKYADLENSFANNENENASLRTDSKTKVSPLSQKRKLNVELFLRNCGRSIKDIIQLLQYGDYEKFEVEKLKRLKEVLPQRDEIEFFQQFEGNAENLEDAEKFLYYMTHLPNHEFRTEALILKAEFNTQLKTISSQSEFFLKTCDLLCEDQSLKIFLRYVLHTGNFLNKGSTFENARGIRISSLKCLMNTKSSTNSYKMSFLHYLVDTSEQGDPGALKFVETMQEPLENASRFPMNGITDEFNQLRKIVKRLKQKCEQTEDEVKTQFTDFLQKADAQMDEADDIIERMHKQSTRLAQYFCENEKNFNPEEFLVAFKDFCENIRICQRDIQQRKDLEDMTKRRRGSYNPSTKSMEKDVRERASTLY